MRCKFVQWIINCALYKEWTAVYSSSIHRVFSRRFSLEKVPDYYNGWVFFFVRPQSSPWMYHFLVQTLISLGGIQRSRVRVPASTRNFSVYLQYPARLKGLIIYNKLEFQKVQRVSPFTFFSTMRLFQTSHFLSEIMLPIHNSPVWNSQYTHKEYFSILS